VRITAFGLYVIRVLATKFCYLEAVMLDTPLADPKASARIRAKYQEGQKPILIDRLLTVESFLTVLESLESRERIRMAGGDLESACPPAMPRIREGVARDIETIKNSDAWRQQEY
jgi:hypothetical protein